MSQDFKSLSWEAISNVPTYGRWLLGTDQRSAYEYHRLALQVLQHGGVRGRWTLKSRITRSRSARSPPCTRRALVLVHRDPVMLCRFGVQPDLDAVGHLQRRRPSRDIADARGSGCSKESMGARRVRCAVFRSTRSSTCATTTWYPIRSATVEAIYTAIDGARWASGTRRATAITAYRDAPTQGRAGCAHLRSRRVRSRRGATGRALLRLRRSLRSLDTRGERTAASGERYLRRVQPTLRRFGALFVDLAQQPEPQELGE